MIQVADQLVALVQQVVGGLAAALDARDFFIDIGNALRQLVDRVDLIGELLGNALLQVIELLGAGAHA